MSGFGGMMSIQVKGGQAEAFKLVAGLKLFSHATSLGEHPQPDRASRFRRKAPNTRSPANLLRLSIGLEHPDDLIDDLSSALKKL